MRSPFLIGLFNPLNLAMLALAVAAGLLSAWWLFPLGLLLWIWMVINVARDPSLQLNLQIERRAPLTQRFQKHFTRIQRLQVNLFNQVKSSPASVRRQIQPVQDALNTLVDESYALCKRLTPLENYLVTSTTRDSLRAEMSMNQIKIEGTDDENLRQELEETQKSLTERLEKLEGISGQLSRAEAQLSSVANELESRMVDVYQLQSLPQDQTRGHVAGILNSIQRLTNDVRLEGIPDHP